MLLTRPDAVNISHQVANYGMGGQYEPHFDFSRVRPKSLVYSEGPALVDLRRLELLGAFQPPHHPLPPPTFCLTRGDSLLPGKPSLEPQGLWSPVEPALTLLLFALILEQRTSVGLVKIIPCPGQNFPCRIVLCSRPFWGIQTYYLPLSLLAPVIWVAGKLVANLGESCCLLQRPFDSGLKTEGNRLATFLNYVSTGSRPTCPLSLNFIEP